MVESNRPGWLPSSGDYRGLSAGSGDAHRPGAGGGEPADSGDTGDRSAGSGAGGSGAGSSVDHSEGPGEAPPGAPSVEVQEPGEWQSRGDPAPSETFGALASEVRVRVLVELLAAERDDEDPLTFSELQQAAGVEESAGFAYHLRQLAGQFVRDDGDGYVLTSAGRRAARAVLAGTFAGDDRRPAS